MDDPNYCIPIYFALYTLFLTVNKRLMTSEEFNTNFCDTNNYCLVYLFYF